MPLRVVLRCCTLRYPLSPLRGQQKIISNKRWMFSTRYRLTFLTSNTTSRKWLTTPLGHDATLTKSRSDVSRPMDVFRNIVDAQLLNRASLHRLFLCAPTSWLPARSQRAAPMYRVLRPRFTTSLMPSCSTGFACFASPYKHTWCVLAVVFTLTRLEGLASPYKYIGSIHRSRTCRDDFLQIGADLPR